MIPIKRFVVTLELVLIFPAAFFMLALVARDLRPMRYEPAHIAEQIVLWYSGRMWTLWLLLLALPFAVLLTGTAALWHSWTRSAKLPESMRKSFAGVVAQPATLVVAATTLAAVCILAIVVLHMAAN